jgi:DeoR family transcriptional regulator, suf operon transcriptional repressor
VLEAELSGATGLQGTRRQLLEVLKRRGEARAEELADALDVTVSAARQHLAALQAAGLVAHRELKGAPGRPKHVYHLTPAAEELFPKAYDELATELVEFVGDEAPELLARLFAQRQASRLARVQSRLEGKPFEARVREVAAILDEDGYLTAVEQLDDGSFVLQEHNCAILGVAQLTQMPCAAEIDFLRDALPDASVERVAHMLGGQHRCAYRIAPAG